MRGRSQDVAERRALAWIAATLLGGVLALQLLRPGGDSGAALTADRIAPRHDAAELAGPVVFAERVERVVGPDPRTGERQLVDEPLCDDPAAESLVEDLRDDGIRFNATWALVRLLELPPGRVPALERALDSPDLQLRHLAAGVLRRRTPDEAARKNRRLLEVSVDALDSRLDVDAHGTWIYPLMQKSARFLVDHAEAAREPLERGLYSGDGQQRLLCAYLLARSGAARQRTRAAYVLAQHLADNSIHGDAVMAVNGLYMLGEDALPVLGDAMRAADEQTRQLVALVVRDLEAPPKSRRELFERAGMHRVTDLYHDPAIEYDVHRSWLPRFGAR